MVSAIIIIIISIIIVVVIISTTTTTAAAAAAAAAATTATTCTHTGHRGWIGRGCGWTPLALALTLTISHLGWCDGSAYTRRPLLYVRMPLALALALAFTAVPACRQVSPQPQRPLLFGSKR